MKDKDINDAIKLLAFVLPVFAGGLIIADCYNTAAGLLLSVCAIVTAAVILWFDWRNEQTKNRLDNYIDDANERIKKVLK